MGMKNKIREMYEKELMKAKSRMIQMNSQDKSNDYQIQQELQQYNKKRLPQFGGSVNEDISEIGPVQNPATNGFPTQDSGSLNTSIGTLGTEIRSFVLKDDNQQVQNPKNVEINDFYDQHVGNTSVKN